MYRIALLVTVIFAGCQTHGEARPDAGSDAHAQFLTKSEPATRVTLVAAGPDRRTVMGAERETLDAYLQAVEESS